MQPSKLNFATVCSGIGAPDLAAKILGWRHQFMSEIESFPRQVLTHHWPEVLLYDDFTKLDTKKWVDKIDCMVAGTPCQSFSTAGRRGGLTDARGNLALEFVRLVQKTKCRWCVLENVPGLLSSGLGYVLAEITGRQELARIERWPTAGLVQNGSTKYSVGWSVLDAQYFGVPQRRKRVFIVASVRGWRSIARVLFECVGGTGDTEEDESTGQATASKTTECAGAGGDNVPVILGGNSKFAAVIDNLSNTILGGSCSNPPIVLAGGASGAEVCYNLSTTVCARNSKGAPIVLPTTTDEIRYLTHTEVERCFGFPDGWTAVEKWSKGVRYKALGNSMAVPVIRWILERIGQQEA